MNKLTISHILLSKLPILLLKSNNKKMIKKSKTKIFELIILYSINIFYIHHIFISDKHKIFKFDFKFINEQKFINIFFVDNINYNLFYNNFLVKIFFIFIITYLISLV